MKYGLSKRKEPRSKSPCEHAGQGREYERTQDTQVLSL
jgi:hypothetical protein